MSCLQTMHSYRLVRKSISAWHKIMVEEIASPPTSMMYSPPSTYNNVTLEAAEHRGRNTWNESLTTERVEETIFLRQLQMLKHNNVPGDPSPASYYRPGPTIGSMQASPDHIQNPLSASSDLSNHGWHTPLFPPPLKVRLFGGSPNLPGQYPSHALVPQHPPHEVDQTPLSTISDRNACIMWHESPGSAPDQTVMSGEMSEAEEEATHLRSPSSRYGLPVAGEAATSSPRLIIRRDSRLHRPCSPVDDAPVEDAPVDCNDNTAAPDLSQLMMFSILR